MQLNFSFSLRFFFSTIIVALVLAILVGCSDEADEIGQPQNTLTALAGTDQAVLINTEVILDGSSSKDEKGKSFDFKWTLKDRPQGSNSYIKNPSSPLSAFLPDKAGVYTIVLTISQGSFSDSDEMRVVVKTEQNETQAIAIESDITEDRILQDVFTDPGKADYVVTKDIQVTSTLNIQPGVVIEFEHDKGLQVMFNGALIAEGTDTQPITFTGTQKEIGYWKGLSFLSNSNLNRLQYVIVEYGGSSELPESPRANISVPGDAISGSHLAITNSTIRYSASYGIYVGGMSLLSEFKEMAITDNAGTAMYCSPKNVSNIDPNTFFSENGFNGIETGGLLNEGVMVSWNQLSSGTYRVNADLTVASKLEIAAGAVLKMAKNVLINVVPGGHLAVNGTAEEKVVFEGVSNISENAWRGILIQSGQENYINFGVVRNAGFSDLPYMTGDRANIGVTAGAKLLITNSLVEKSIGWGIALQEGSFFNENIHIANTFGTTSLGSVKFPIQSQPLDITGEWVEFASLMANTSINENFYDRQTREWFGGANDPWSMTPQTAFGLKVDASGNYVWTIAVQHSTTECISYSAEHFTGHVSANGEVLNFVEESWRSKYVNSCTPDENVDFEVQPGEMLLAYQITKEFLPYNNREYTVLTITSGGETFKLYKK